jgi:hypothetical protein
MFVLGADPLFVFSANNVKCSLLAYNSEGLHYAECAAGFAPAPADISSYRHNTHEVEQHEWPETADRWTG